MNNRKDHVCPVVEPKVFHVSKSEFEKTVGEGMKAGFKALSGPNMFFGRTAILKRPDIPSY